MPELIGFTDMELSVGEQFLGFAVAGMGLGAAPPHPLTSSRLARSAEGVAAAGFLGLMFLLGAGRLDDADRSPVTLAVSGLGLLPYCAAVHAPGRAALGWKATIAKTAVRSRQSSQKIQARPHTTTHS